jgi:hypothetical protein
MVSDAKNFFICVDHLYLLLRNVCSDHLPILKNWIIWGFSDIELLESLTWLYKYICVCVHKSIYIYIYTYILMKPIKNYKNKKEEETKKVHCMHV